MKHCILIACAFVLFATGLAAQPTPGTSVLKDLRMPVFNEFGTRIWDLSAASATRLTENTDRFELTTVHVVIFKGDLDGTVEAELFAPLAVVDQPARTVAGPGQLHFIGRGVELFGNDWICYADTKSIVIERDVVVTFSSNLGNILR